MLPKAFYSEVVHGEDNTEHLKVEDRIILKCNRGRNDMSCRMRDSGYGPVKA
jgi:hypothetical protein